MRICNRTLILLGTRRGPTSALKVTCDPSDAQMPLAKQAMRDVISILAVRHKISARYLGSSASHHKRAE